MPDFVNPERKILNQFDLNPWFFSMVKLKTVNLKICNDIC